MSNPVRRAVFLGVVVMVALAAPGAARAQTATPSPTTAPGPTVTGAQDQVMLSGSVLVPRGLTVGEVVVFHGRAVVLGVSLGDVVVLDGPVTIAGQVSGSVIALNGPIRLAATASVRGDVLGAETVKVEQGATIGGDVRQDVAFTPRGSLSVLGALLGGAAIAFSTLLVGLLLLLLAPRGADRVASAARSAPLASVGWGIVLAIGLPLLAVLAAATILGLPLGLSLLLALAFVFLVGATWSIWSVGRALVREPRSRWLAFLAGWGIALAVSLVPYLNAAAWTVASIYGLGAMTVAVWRARGTGGRHRSGYVEIPETEPAPPPPAPPPESEPAESTTD